jgi:hypothetical protein
METKNCATVLLLDSCHFDRPNKAAAVRDSSEFKKRHILTAVANHGRSLWNGLGKINYCLIRPKFGKMCDFFLFLLRGLSLAQKK